MCQGNISREILFWEFLTNSLTVSEIVLYFPQTANETPNGSRIMDQVCTIIWRSGAYTHHDAAFGRAIRRGQKNSDYWHGVRVLRGRVYPTLSGAVVE